MFRLINSTESNTWHQDYLDMQMIYNEAEKIKHTKGKDICIIFEKNNYFELVIFNEWVSSSFGRFIFAKDYYWTDEEEIKFSSFVKDECVAYNHGQVRKLYDRFSLEFPEWNLKFRTDKPLRMFEQIHHCMQIGSVIEEYLNKKLGKKLSREIPEETLYLIYDVLINEKDCWNTRLLESNKNRNKENEFSDERYSIVYPKSTEEFVIESIVQHNCLMFYLDKYVNNQTDIMFLRKAECKEDSYVTLEIREGKMVQAFLKYNEKPDKEVMEWLKMYARKKRFEFELEVWE